jgi:very-short-patch-repair endonuclease
VELDGEPHHRILREDYESARTRYLEGLGITILRFENKIVFENIEAILETIREEIRRIP